MIYMWLKSNTTHELSAIRVQASGCAYILHHLDWTHWRPQSCFVSQTLSWALAFHVYMRTMQRLASARHAFAKLNRNA